ncbi:MAG: DHH family phosphoesterase [Erysipelotrichaceae bacterium]|nr:DHH family phosphoesterase [Erysipelotrichaceae bacterium]
MEKRTESLRIIALILFLVQIILTVVMHWIFRQPFDIMAAVFTVVDAILVVYLFYCYENEKKARLVSISRVLGSEAKDALIYSQMGIVTYDDDYIVTWCSELFDQRGMNMIGERLTRILPGTEVLLNGDSDKIIINVGDTQYEVLRGETSRVLFVRDVTEYNKLEENYEDEKLVLGLVHLDNYEETIQYEDEQKIANINTNIRQKIIEWCKGYNSIVRRIRGDRFLVILTEKEFRRMLESRFTILGYVKKEAAHLNVAISVSMAFAHGTSDFNELDNMINDLIELVLSRGGDQVAVREYGQDVRFYGMSSEASEKNSKVQVRVMAHTLRGIVKESDNVFIVPHKDADFDAVGASLGLSRLIQAFGKTASVVMKGISIEDEAQAVVTENLDKIEDNHNIISEEEALEFLTKKSLVIVCDHHSADLTSAPQLVNDAKRIVVIDHHRRKQETNIEAMMVYNEPSASSTVELVTELIEFQPARVELTAFEATFMYTGLLVDTDNFRSRCSSRSFEVCAYLRKEGADISMANEWLKETVEQFETRNKVLSYSEIINGNICIAALPEKEGIISRTMVAQVANSVLDIRNMDASFVIAQVDENTWAVSGRSNGEVNVQIILEAMGGGGHFAAAGVQKTDTSTKQLRDELMEAINNYLEGVDTDESNSAE